MIVCCVISLFHMSFVDLFTYVVVICFSFICLLPSVSTYVASSFGFLHIVALYSDSWMLTMVRSATLVGFLVRFGHRCIIV